jgi:hypothetical protein
MAEAFGQMMGFDGEVVSHAHIGFCFVVRSAWCASLCSLNGIDAAATGSNDQRIA